MSKVLKIGDEEFEEVDDLAINASGWLVESWQRLGKPETPLSEAGGKMMSVMIAAWEELYPLQAKQWYEDRKDYKASEMTISDQVRKHTGRSLASYPFPIYQMMKQVFPTFKAGERNNCIKLVAKFPMFQMCNTV